MMGMNNFSWKKRIVFAFIVIFIYLFFLSLCVGYYLSTNFANVSFEQILFNLAQPLESADQRIVQKGVLWCGILPALATLILTLAYYWYCIRAHRNMKKLYISLIAVILCFSLSATYLYKASKIGAYIEAQRGSGTVYQEYYVDPESVQYSFPEKKRNLIYIYMESMEQSYADKKAGGDFNKSLIPNLSKIKQEGESFGTDSIFLHSGAMGWTMASLVAQTSGINIKSYQAQEEFNPNATVLPGAYALGNILEKNGYTNIFLMGSDANFASRSTYLKTHGNYEIRDVFWAKGQGLISEKYWENWGYEDKKLFTYAKDALTDLDKNQPFNLTLLTADTHFYDGYLCSDCLVTDEGQYSDVIRCSDKRIYEFIKWCQKQKWYPDTTIVLVGDHLTMDDNWAKRLDPDYQRSIFYTILNSPAVPERKGKRTFTAIDMFPTTLSSLGVKYDKGRLGLGTDLYKSEDTLVEMFGLEKLDTMLSSPSNYYVENFWR